MKNSHLYILDGKIPIPCPEVLDWGRWFEDHTQERIVKQEDIGPYWVSTIFLGVDHRFFGNGPPMLFETLVFEGRSIRNVIYMERTSTWELALEQHATACQWAREQLS